MVEGLYDKQILLEYENSNKKLEITTNAEVYQILLSGKDNNEQRQIRVHSKIPDKIRLIQFREPDFFIGDNLRLYRCQRDFNRPYEVNTSDLSFGFSMIGFGTPRQIVPYIFKLVICGDCSREELTQVECADSIIICPKCNTVFDI